MILNIIIACVTVYISTKLFKQAAGTLSIGKINIISYIFYLCILQTLAGAILVSFGYNEHYTLKKLVFFQESIDMAVLSVYFMMIALPFCMVVFFKIFKVNPEEEYKKFLKRDIEEKQNDKLFFVIGFIGVVQICLLILLLIRIGYVPLIKIFVHNDVFDFALERQRNEKIYILGNDFIKNIFIIWGIPIISYITASYALINREKKWISLAIICFFAALITQTYDFSKSPVVFHLFVYLLIFIYYRGGIKNMYIVISGGVGIAILIFFYRVFGFEGSFIDIYNGILGRTLFTQFGTLCYHFDMFPNIFSYLYGRSLYPTVLTLIGNNPEDHLRSSEIVMDFYGSDYVYDGTAGVMNTVFIGEAYANWGWGGILFSILWCALVVVLVFSFIIKIKKTPATIAFLAVATKIIGSMIQGGFVDFIYNFTFVLMIGGFVLVIYFNNILEKICILAKYILNCK